MIVVVSNWMTVRLFSALYTLDSCIKTSLGCVKFFLGCIHCKLSLLYSKSCDFSVAYKLLLILVKHILSSCQCLFKFGYAIFFILDALFDFLDSRVDSFLSVLLGFCNTGYQSGFRDSSNHGFGNTILTLKFIVFSP